MSHVKLTLPKAGDALNAESFNATIDSWDGREVSSENLRDQGLDIQNFKKGTGFDHSSGHSPDNFWHQTGVVPLSCVVQGPFDFNKYDYILRVSMEVWIKGDLTVTDASKKYAIRMWVESEHNAINIKRKVAFSTRLLGFMGRQIIEKKGRENYTVAFHLNNTWPNIVYSGNNTIDFHWYFDHLVNDYSQLTPKVSLNNITSSVTKYVR